MFCNRHDYVLCLLLALCVSNCENYSWIYGLRLAQSPGSLGVKCEVPWLLLLPVGTFFTMEGGDSEFANSTLPTLKAFLEARSHNVSGNKQ